MRLTHSTPALLSLLVASFSSPVTAGPFPRAMLDDMGLSFLMPRQCVAYCGVQSQYCCTQGQACYTVGTIAGCSTAPPPGYAAPTNAAGGYVVYTLTLTETNLSPYTTLSTSYYQQAPTTAAAPAPTVAAGPAYCDVSLGQTSCGSICCASFQRCAKEDQCEARPESTLFPIVPVPVPTIGSYSAPYRPTSTGLSTVTNTVSATTTAPFLAPATASGSVLPTAFPVASGGGLSAGAIAGIVIGVIAGLLLLLLLCFCCIVKTGFDGLLAIFGLGKRKRRSTERIETVEHYSRHGSQAGSRRDQHTGWFGGPAKVDAGRKKKSSGFGGLGAVGAGLAGLALVLGLKRKNDKSEKPARSDISSSYYTDSYTGTSASK